MTTALFILGASWFICLLCSMAALSLTFILSGQRWSPLFLALTSALLSIMGLTGRTPLGHLPDIAWSWSNDSFLISLRLASAFLLPLVLAIIAVAFLLGRTISRAHRAEPSHLF